MKRNAQRVLDELEPGAVVLDQRGHAWQLGNVHGDPYWYRAYGDDESVSSWDIRHLGPFTVLHNPPKRFPSRPPTHRPEVEAVFVEMRGAFGSP